MKVEVDEFVICAETDHLSNLSVNGQSVAEVVEYPRADEVTIFDRKNNRTQVSFTVTSGKGRFETLEEAFQFLLMHGSEIQTQGTVKFSFTNSAGAVIERYLYDAMVTGFAGTHNGLTTIFNYNIIGGKMKDVPPPAT